MPAIDIPGIIHRTPERIGDARGYFSETYRADQWPAPAFMQDNESLSPATGTLRGLHFQAPPHAQAKLLRCLAGEAYCVAVDIRRGSPTYGRHAATRLSAKEGVQMYVPTGFAQGFLTLVPDTLVQWKVSAGHAPQLAFGLAWDDPALEIDWPLAGAPLLSERDRRHPALKDLPAYFSWPD